MAPPSPRTRLAFHNVSVGDLLIVYWDGDRKWYPGEVVGVRGDHECEFLYEDGEREWMSLNAIKFMARRNWKRSIRQRKNKDDDPFDTIKKILFDIEDRLPTEGVFEKNIAWWKEWHDGILVDVELNNIRGLMNATLKVSLQLKPNITSTWWDTHSDEWKKRLQTASTVHDASVIVKELLTNAINWSKARDLFSNDKEQSAIVSELRDIKGLDVEDGGQGLDQLHRLSGGPNASSQKFYSHINRDWQEVRNLFTEDMGMHMLRRPNRLQVKPASDARSAGITCHDHKRDPICVDAVDSRGEDMGMHALRRSNRLKVKPTSDAEGGSIRSHEHKRHPFCVDDINPMEGSLRRSKRLKQEGFSGARHSMVLSQTLSIESESSKDTTSDSSSVSDFSQQFDDSERECSADSSVDNFCKTRKARFRSPDAMNHRVNNTSSIRKDCLAEQAKMMPRAKRSKRSGVPEAVKYSKRITNEEIVRDADLFDKSYDEDGSENGVCRSLDELSCYICQTGEAGCFLLLCDGIDCLRAFHTFCLYPPLQMVPEGDWLCPYCEGGKLFSDKLVPKKIKKIIGRRRITNDQEENSLQDQFLIKWESLAHHHDSWVPMEWVNHVDCVRLHNFLKKFPVLMGGVSVIDFRKPEWFKIDRVIACRRKFDAGYFCEIRNLSHKSHGIGELEFLVKWMGLDYGDATWESSCTVELLAEVDKLVCRHQRAFERSDKCYHRSHISRLDVQPSYLKGGVLYDYQMMGLNWMLNNFMSRTNVILADEMGLGKTVQVVSFVYSMKQENLSNLPVLIISPKSILFHWEKEFHRWAEELNVVVYQGERESRKCIRAHELYSAENRELFDALITNYEMVLLDNSVLRKFKWSAIIIDEAHKIKKLDGKLSICLSQYITDFRLLLTGTPLQNTLLELFALLHFLDPKEFSDPKAEAASFSTIGKESIDSEMKVSQIHELLRPRMLRRMKSDVLPGVVPTKKWVEVPCALTDSQRELYVNLLKKNYKELNRGIHSGKKITLNSLLMELRKCCNHPYLFPGREPNHSSREQALVSLVASSGKLQLLEKLLPKLKERGNRVLLFSQFTTMLDILEDFLLLLGLTYFRIDGKTSTSARLQQLQEFNKPGCTVFIFLISTRAGGVGIDLVLEIEEKLWDAPSGYGFYPCVKPTQRDEAPQDSDHYITVKSNGGLNQMRTGICDMVAVARIMNATLVIPQLDKRSFWRDSSTFSDIFDEDHFITTLQGDIRIVKELPKDLESVPTARKHFTSWSGLGYYKEMTHLWKDYKVIHVAKSDSRLSNNDLPLDVQKLRCRALYYALNFAPPIENLGKKLVERLRAHGKYIALHLRYEKDMLSFTGCNYGLTDTEAEELRIMRENTNHWKMKKINSTDQRIGGYCPLTPKEVGIFLRALGYPPSTWIYIAAGEIYGGDSHLSDLRSQFSNLVFKETMATTEELKSFANHASQTAALDYIVSVESDVFVPSYSGNMARAVEGHRRFLGHRKTINPDRKGLVEVFDKLERGQLKEGSSFSSLVTRMHEFRQGAPRKRAGPLAGIKGRGRFRTEESFYENPFPECICKTKRHARNYGERGTR